MKQFLLLLLGLFLPFGGAGRFYQHNKQGITNTASATLALFGDYSTAAVRTAYYEMNIGSDAAPAEQATTYSIARISAAGVWTNSDTANPLDSNDPAATSVSKSVNTTTATKGVELLQWAQNMRAWYRWVAVPGRELIAPATANAGLAVFSVVTTAAYAVSISAAFTE
jgi:hypothetical protein